MSNWIVKLALALFGLSKRESTVYHSSCLMVHIVTKMYKSQCMKILLMFPSCYCKMWYRNVFVWTSKIMCDSGMASHLYYCSQKRDLLVSYVRKLIAPLVTFMFILVAVFISSSYYYITSVKKKEEEIIVIKSLFTWPICHIFILLRLRVKD